MTSITINKPPTYTLDEFTSRYHGLFRIHRLISMANVFSEPDPSLHAAIRLIQAETWNVKLYEQLIDRLNIPADQEWIEHSWSQFSEQMALTNKHISELRSKFHAEPVATRDIHIEQARIFLKMGEYLEARKTLNRILEYAGDSDDVDHASLIVDNALISMLLGQWPHARTIVGKELGKNSSYDSPVKSYLFPDDQFLLTVIHGLCLLSLGDFEEAVAAFLQHMPVNWSKCLAPQSDIALFIVIIALAIFPRPDLQYLIDKDPVLAAYLEHDEQTKQLVTQLVQNFLDMDYKSLFQILTKHDTDLRADFYLGSHYDILFEAIVERSILQYLSVFDTVPLDTYNLHFDITNTDVDEKLTKIIQEKQLPFRIDISQRMIHRIEPCNTRKLVDETENLVKGFIRNSMLTFSDTQSLYDDRVKSS